MHVAIACKRVLWLLLSQPGLRVASGRSTVQTRRSWRVWSMKMDLSKKVEALLSLISLFAWPRNIYLHCCALSKKSVRVISDV